MRQECQHLSWTSDWVESAENFWTDGMDWTWIVWIVSYSIRLKRESKKSLTFLSFAPLTYFSSSLHLNLLIFDIRPSLWSRSRVVGWSSLDSGDNSHPTWIKKTLPGVKLSPSLRRNHFLFLSLSVAIKSRMCNGKRWKFLIFFRKFGWASVSSSVSVSGWMLI